VDVIIFGSEIIFLLFDERLRFRVSRSIGCGILFWLLFELFCAFGGSGGKPSTDFEILARLTTGSIGLVVTSGIVRFREVRLIGAVTSEIGSFCWIGFVGAATSAIGCFREVRLIGAVTSGIGFFLFSIFC